MSKRCENCKHVKKESEYRRRCAVSTTLVSRNFLCPEWEDSHPQQTISAMTNNTHQLLKQIEELRAIADKMSFLTKRANDLNIYDYGERVILNEAIKRYNTEKESR